MKKILLWISALALIGLCGCASKKAGPGEQGVPKPKGQKISAYYYASFEEITAVRTKLEAAGFEIVGTYALTDKSETLIITNEALKRAANRPGRGFAAILRVLIDKEHNRVAVTNPVYFGKAFLQDAYNHTLALRLTQALASALGALTPSPDTYDYDALDSFRFMVSLPQYKDVYHLAEGETASLVAALDDYLKGKFVVFKLSVGEGRTLVGIDLTDRTKQFVNVLGTQNAEILPYTILIEDGNATALEAKYYIAISYPLLTMAEFMDIVSVPGAIEEELERPFR
jgi:hypothetical protein